VTEAPRALNAEYYAQRTARGGLVVTEGALARPRRWACPSPRWRRAAGPLLAPAPRAPTPPSCRLAATAVSPAGRGYMRAPNMYDAANLAGWRLVTDAIHAKGGFAFAQLFHAGRVTHSLITGTAPLAPSAVKMEGVLRTPDGKARGRGGGVGAASRRGAATVWGGVALVGAAGQMADLRCGGRAQGRGRAMAQGKASVRAPARACLPPSRHAGPRARSLTRLRPRAPRPAPPATPRQQPYETPAEMTREQIKGVVAEFRAAAERAVEAGFDGIELHGGGRPARLGPARATAEREGSRPTRPPSWLCEGEARLLGSVLAPRRGPRPCRPGPRFP
jgi:hypothetical protein